jgi:hypothetical protein
MRRSITWAGLILLLAGCHDSSTGPGDLPPAAPRGVYSITGDHEVFLSWLENTESDVAGYKIYEGPCERGGDCPYDPIATTTVNRYVVTGLTNGATRYYAVTAFDRHGNESPLSDDAVFDTPRPEGFGRMLSNYLQDSTRSGFDFSADAVRPYRDQATDMFFGSSNGLSMMFSAFTDVQIQDAGFASSLDAVDFAPLSGWSPSGGVEVVVGHCYVVWTQQDDHYGKFRVTAVTPSQVQLDWAYQIDPGNRELRARPARRGGPRVSRPVVWGS